MEPILTLDHLSYAYHTLEGETKALSDISLSVKICGNCRSIRMRQVHTALTDRRSFETGRGGDSAQWKIIKRKRDQYRLYAAARPPL